MSGVIQVVDANMGNIASVLNMLKRVGADATRVCVGKEFCAQSKIVLPGVGSFDAAMSALHERGLDTAVRDAADRGARILGICLGMQLLFQNSDEGVTRGLALIPGRVERFKIGDKTLKIPHMGWNVARPLRNSDLFSQADEEQRFYFVHSYHASCADAADAVAVAHHGYEFTCAVQRGNVMGVQFHPEKSHRFGMALMKRFVEL
jgi:glutamine amidotransferase